VYDGHMAPARAIHGTRYGFMKHQLAKVEPCEACKRANAAYFQAWRLATGRTSSTVRGRPRSVERPAGEGCDVRPGSEVAQVRIQKDRELSKTIGQPYPEGVPGIPQGGTHEVSDSR
jgi:hypothetical protein